MASEELPLEAVEAAAKAAYEAGLRRKMNMGPPWDELEPQVQAAWHDYARVIAEAAFEAMGMKVERAADCHWTYREGIPAESTRLRSDWHPVEQDR